MIYKGFSYNDKINIAINDKVSILNIKNDSEMDIGEKMKQRAIKNYGVQDFLLNIDLLSSDKSDNDVSISFESCCLFDDTMSGVVSFTGASTTTADSHNALKLLFEFVLRCLFIGRVKYWVAFVLDGEYEDDDGVLKFLFKIFEEEEVFLPICKYFCDSLRSSILKDALIDEKFVDDESITEFELIDSGVIVDDASVDDAIVLSLVNFDLSLE